MTEHPFEVGSQYRNRRDDYEVLSISGETMRIRYSDGTEQTVKINIQARIWENIEAEIAPPPSSSSQDDGLDTYPIQELVQTVLNTISKPYSEDLIDEVCAAIEQNPEWLSRYYALVEHFSSRGKNGRLTVNSSIGWYTKDLTGLAALSYPHQATKSKLITTYTKLTRDKG
jgi:hypothetical protein